MAGSPALCQSAARIDMTRPRRPSPRSDDPADSAPLPAPGTSVLVVDADCDARDLYRQSLAASGLRVYEAVDGREALVQIHKLKPNAVVLDARLAYIDGLQLCALLKGDAATAALRIVAITSEGAPEHLQRFRERGADVVFVKPVQIESLASSIFGRSDGASGVGVDSPAPARSRARARLHERYVSTTPPEPPPHLRCPQCDGLLQYDHSHVGGVSERHPEQWDYFTCAAHGAFQYRHRTRRLRPVY